MRSLPVAIITLFLGGYLFAQNGIAPGAFAAFALGDPDGNGKHDLLFAGNDPSGNSGIAEWDSETGFSPLSLPVTPYATSVGWTDLNNDGKEDYFMFGSGTGACNLYFQQTDGSFTVRVFNSGSTILDPDVTVIDFDNDGDNDLFVSGWDVDLSKRFSTLYENDGNGTFIPLNTGLIEKGYGSSCWGDVNADGLPDLLLNGDGDGNGDNGSYDIYRLYRNNGDGSFTAIQVFETYRQISVGDGSRFADWNNDGFPDIILTGWSNNESRQVTAIYTNDGSGSFSRDALTDQLPGVSESSIEVADMNRDSRIDLLLTGYSGSFARNVCLLITNETSQANSAPSVPTGSNEETDTTSVTLSWERATDNTTPALSLSYNFYLRDLENDRWLTNPFADTISANTGYRATAAHGNASWSLKRTVHDLPESKYAWGVQAVDAAYLCSAFTPQRIFAIKDTAALRMLLDEAINLLDQAVAGTQPGMSSQEAIDSLAATISLIEPWIGAKDKSRLDFSTALEAALAYYNDALVGVNIQVIDSLINIAGTLLEEAQSGDRDGEYPAAVISALTDELNAALSSRESALAISDLAELAGAQLDVDNAAAALESGIETFLSGKIEIDYAPLLSKIADAIALYEGSEAGLCNGCFPQAAFNDLSLAIEVAVNLAFTPLSESELNQAVTDLQAAISVFIAQMILIDKTELGVLIDSANYIHDNADVDDYEAGAKFALKIAINEATQVYVNTSATAYMVNSAVSALKTAISKFHNSKLTNTVMMNSELLISPNPARDRIYVTGMEGRNHLRITDNSGKKLLETETADERTSIDLSSFNCGFYLLILEGENGYRSVKKFIITR